MAEPITLLSCSFFAPMASATFAHCAATNAAADATDDSLLSSWFEFSAAMAASAAATPATDMAACTSAFCNLFSSFLFCFISLSHFLIEKFFSGAIFHGICTNTSYPFLSKIAVLARDPAFLAGRLEPQSCTRRAKGSPLSQDVLVKALASLQDPLRRQAGW
nr:hypothetical protein Iba_chr02fCG12960 [Ipomoea batatas]